jgi:hypothetical protein
LVNSGDGKWAFSGAFREAPIDLPNVDVTKQTPVKRPIRIDLRMQDGNGESSRQGWVPLAAIYRFHDDVQRART